MRDEQFDVPVTIESEGSGLTVTGTVQAASLLVDGWPDEERGPKYRSALKAMMDAMEQRCGGWHGAPRLHRRSPGSKHVRARRPALAC